jgi:hypothetical protein
MTATTPVAFDPNPKHLGLQLTFKAGSAILRGQVVAFADAATSRTVVPALRSVGMPIGVALNSQATTGGDVDVAMQGSVVTVMMAADNSTLDAGHWVMPSTVAGTVVEWDPEILGHVATADLVTYPGRYPIGYALDDSTTGGSTVGSTVEIVVNVTPLWSNRT